MNGEKVIEKDGTMYRNILFFIAAVRASKSAMIMGTDYVVIDAKSYEDLRAQADRAAASTSILLDEPIFMHIEELATIPDRVFQECDSKNPMTEKAKQVEPGFEQTASRPHLQSLKDFEALLLHQTESSILSTGQASKSSSERGKEWLRFSDAVFDHVENYARPQYGDKPNDQISSWSVATVMQDIRKRTHRVGRNSRGLVEDLRDCLKMANESCIAFFKILEAMGTKLGE